MDIYNQYTIPHLPGSFSGKTTFIRELKRRNKKFNTKDIKEWLAYQDTYTLHFPYRKKFRRNRIIVGGIDDTWQADLVDVSNISHYNNDHKFLLTVIDVFSKFAWVRPIKNKSASSIVTAFKSIFSEGRLPQRIQTDEGSEFINKSLKNFLKTINLYTLNSEMKAAIIERFNRTLRQKMWRYFTFKQSYRYIDVVQDLVTSYNNSYHRTIKTSPNQVNITNETKIWSNIYGFEKNEGDHSSISFKFNIGDKVRIAKSKTAFEKGYTANWTREIFYIDKIIPRVPPVYIIKDEAGEVIKGIFYEQQLQKVEKKDDIYYIQEVIKSKFVNGKKQHFVKWLGYPDKFNSWISTDDIIDFNNINNFKLSTDDKPIKSNRVQFSI